MNKEIFKNMMYHIIGCIIFILLFNIGFSLFLSLTTKQDINKFREFKRTAETGNSKAQFKLAKYYFEGKVIEKNQEEALKWFIKSAEQGYGEAELTLSNMYDRGIVVAQNKLEAKKWLKKGLKDIGFFKFFCKGGWAFDSEGDAFNAINNIHLIASLNSDWVIIIATIIFFIIWSIIKIDTDNTNGLHRIIISWAFSNILCYCYFAFFYN